MRMTALQRRIAGWLAVATACFNLLAPAICWAQEMRSGPPGAICSADRIDSTAPGDAYSDDASVSHRVHPCEHCAVAGEFVAPASAVAVLSAPVAGVVASRPGTQAFAPAAILLRPPPRGPPALG